MEPENKFEERLRIINQALSEKPLIATLSNSTRDNVERSHALMDLIQNQLATAHRGMDLAAQRGHCTAVEEAVEACQQYFDTMSSCAQNINSLESRLGTGPAGGGIRSLCTAQELLEGAASPLQKKLLESMMIIIYDDHFCYVEGAVNGTNGSITLFNFIKLLAGEWRRDTLCAVVAHMNARCANGYLGTFCAAVEKRLFLLLGSLNQGTRIGEERQLAQFGEALKWFETHCAHEKVLKTRQYRVALVASILRYLKNRDLKEDHTSGNHEHAKKLLRLVHRIKPGEMCFLSKEMDEYITELRKAKRYCDDDRAVLERFIKWHDTPTKSPDDMSFEEFCDSLKMHADYITTSDIVIKDLYFQYTESFDTRYDLCAECTHQSLHAILVKLTRLLQRIACIKPERPLQLSARQREQYLSMVAIFLNDIELSREGVNSPCLCCGVSYRVCLEELLLGDQSPLNCGLIQGREYNEQHAHIVHTLKQLRILIRLPSIEQTLWGDDGGMNVEESCVNKDGDHYVIDEVVPEDDGITIGHFDTEEEEDTIVAEDESM